MKEVSTGSASPVTWPSRWITARKLRHKAYVRRQRSLQRKTKANIESFFLNPGKHKLSDVTVMMLLRVHNQCLSSQVLFCILMHLWSDVLKIECSLAWNIFQTSVMNALNIFFTFKEFHYLFTSKFTIISVLLRGCYAFLYTHTENLVPNKTITIDFFPYFTDHLSALKHTLML